MKGYNWDKAILQSPWSIKRFKVVKKYDDRNRLTYIRKGYYDEFDGTKVIWEEYTDYGTDDRTEDDS